jgi:O-antigen ligase
MFKERPWFGHGMNTDTAYRTKYYEAFGLGALKKKYEAHNMFLQMAVNGGLVALGLFTSWFAWWTKEAWKKRREHWSLDAAFITWIAFMVASLVQNSFQDSEVRYALTLFVTAQCLYRAKNPFAASNGPSPSK